MTIARLPSRFDLSQPQSGRSGRAIASYDTSAIGRGVASMGAAISDIGADISRQRNTVDLARAEAYKTKGFIDTENEFSQDGDYSTFNKRAPEKTGEVVNKAADLIRDPAMREKWKIGAQTDAIRTNDAIGDKARALGQQAETVAFDDALEVNRRLYVDPTTSEAVKAKAKADIEASIATGQGTGLLTPAEAAARRDTYITNANFSRAKLAVEQDPSQFMPGDVTDRIIGVESGGNANAKNPNSSATGAGQFIDSTWMATVKAHRPDLLEGRTTADVLALRKDKALSKEMVGHLANDNAGFLRNQGIQPTDGDIYLAHFLGPRGASQVLKADPGASVASIVGQDVVNANPFLKGMTANDVRAWSNKKMGSKTPAYFNDLSPEEKQIVYNQAETRQRQIQVAQQGNIETVVQNAPVAVQNTGTYDGNIPSQTQFMDAYGPQEGSERYAKFTAQMDVGAQSYNFRTMSVQDIEAAVAEAKPTSSGDDAAVQTARYETLANAAETTIKARQADPAAYVQQAFPSVNRAWTAAAETGNYQQALTETANAQTQLGIQNMKLMPKTVADSAITKFKDENAPEQDRINAVTGLIFSTPDAGQRQAVFNQLVDSGLPDTTEGAVDALARGDEGAGRRLMQAALVDPTKLPGQAPFKPAEIDAEIQAKIMDEGQIGDVFYGLSDGSVENQQRAIRDSKLLTNAVNLRVRNGETLDAAVNAASKDLYGDVKPMTGDGNVNAQVLLPAEADPDTYVGGFTGLLPTVRSQLETAVVVPKEAGVADGGNAVLQGVRSNYIDSVMSEGYFRNSEDGYVFIDPFVGAAIAGADGKPLIFTDSDVLGASTGARPAPTVDAGNAGGSMPAVSQEQQDERYGVRRQRPAEIAEPETVEPISGGGGGY